MRKSSFRLVAAAAAIALAVTGCSSSKNDAANTDTKFEIFTWWASGGEAAGLQGMIDVYKAQNPNTEFINAAVAGGAGVNAKAVLTSRLEANDPPDSFQAHAGMELDGYVKTGKLEDLTSLYQSEGWDKVFPADLIKTLTVDGKIYSVPVNIHRANVLWWNPATATKAGITAAPQTLDEFFADLEKFKKAGVTGLALAGKGDWAIAHLMDYMLLASMGPDKYEGLFKGTTSWTGPEVTAALKNFQKALSYGNKGAGNLDWPDAGKLVTSGKAGFFIMGDWASAQWQSDGLKLGTDYTFAAAPGTVGIYQWLSDSFTLPVGAPHRNAALAWLKVCGSLEGQDAFNPKKGSIAVRTDSDLTKYDDYLKSAAADWKKDRLVGSTVHGVNGNNALMAAYNAAVGKYFSGGFKDNAGLAKDLAAAYEAGKA
ncbi:MAG: extracellular solute-binding protein [Actinomycetes bacterium]|jgi:glucose/mannose transport system substrate-binding protein